MRKKLSGQLSMGEIVATPNALRNISEDDILLALWRHAGFDWGNVCDMDWQSNNEAAEKGFRVLSVYKSFLDEDFWIITEADRSYTTILMPKDY